MNENICQALLQRQCGLNIRMDGTIQMRSFVSDGMGGWQGGKDHEGGTQPGLQRPSPTPFLAPGEGKDRRLLRGEEGA